MPDHSTPNHEDAQTQATILTLLFDKEHQQPWAVEELSREIGRPNDVCDAVASLHGSGLIHRFGDFVFATRAARRLDQLDL